MRKFFVLVFLKIGLVGHAQIKPVFKTLRYDENYEYLKNDSNETWYKHSKFNPLSKSKTIYLSTGGDVRYQYFTIQNENWGDAEQANGSFLFSRLLLHADLHLGAHFRTFVQVQSSLVNGREFTSPVDEDPLEFHQVFLDFVLNPHQKNKWTFRFGRQELAYGSQRLLSVREGPNNRQSFDGIKSSLTSTNYQLDFFYTHYVIAKKGFFDDPSSKDSQLWGIYLAHSKIPILKNIDIYYLGLWKQHAKFDEGAGSELRHSVGSRIWRSAGNFKSDIEGLYQFGDFASEKINAWTLSLNNSYKFSSVKLKPELGLKTELISGNKVYGDNKLETFNPLFPRGAYFGLASLIGPSNLFDIHPSLTLELTKKLFFDADYDMFWRYSTQDGIYGPNVAMIYSGKNNPYSFIGKQLAFDFIYTPNSFLYFRAEFTWFKAGAFLKVAGSGKDIVFTGLTALLHF